MAFDDGDADASCEERPEQESQESTENRDRVMSLSRMKDKPYQTILNTP